LVLAALPQPAPQGAEAVEEVPDQCKSKIT